MDALALLHRAQEAGLRIEVMDDTLLVRGPPRAEAVVKLLAEHKAEVLAALSPVDCNLVARALHGQGRPMVHR